MSNATFAKGKGEMTHNMGQGEYQANHLIGGAKNSNKLYLFYMRLILFPVKF
jgi:hypothetical protein